MDDQRHPAEPEWTDEHLSRADAEVEEAPRHDEREAGDKPGRDEPAQGEPRRDDSKQGDGKDDDRAPKKRGPRWGVWILAAVVLIGAIIGGIFWFLGRNEVSTDDAYTDGRAIMIAPRIKGIVVALNVNDNQFVHAGDLLVKIDPRDYIAARDQARGQVDMVQGQLDSAAYGVLIAKKNFPARLQAAEANVKAAQAQVFKAQTDYNRQHNISRSATTQQDIDTSTANARAAEAQLAQAEAQQTEAEPVKESIGQSTSQVSTLQGQVEQARAALAQAELNLGYTEVRAPQDGWITKRNVEQGNYVEAGTQIFSVVTPEVWITANFKETELNRMRPGQRVDIAVDAYPWLKLTGHVDSVQLGSGSKFSAFPAENATGNFVKIVQRVPVKIDIDSGLSPDHPLPLGLSVEPTVHVGG